MNNKLGSVEVAAATKHKDPKRLLGFIQKDDGSLGAAALDVSNGTWCRISLCIDTTEISNSSSAAKDFIATIFHGDLHFTCNREVESHYNIIQNLSPHDISLL